MCISNTSSRNVAFSSNRAIPRDAAAFLANNLVKENFVAQQVPQQQNLTVPEPPAKVVQHDAHGAHIIVQHNYHDHANDPESAYQEEHPARGGVTTPFPLKLHEMLERVQADGYEHIVSWQPHGRCFVVHKPKEFVDLLPRYFKLSKLASFQRQLNLYGFQRLTRGRDRGGYYHELFLRGKVFLSHNIQRIKVKGTGVRARSNPDQEPDLWSMTWVNTGGAATNDQAPAATSPVASVPCPNTMANEIAKLTRSIDMTIAQLPLNIQSRYEPAQAPSYMPVQQEQPTMAAHDDDLICAFGNKTFHYIDPFKPVNSSLDVLLDTREADAFFDGFDFDEQVGSGLEDDAMFGDMLERIIE